MSAVDEYLTVHYEQVQQHIYVMKFVTVLFALNLICHCTTGETACVNESENT